MPTFRKLTDSEVAVYQEDVLHPYLRFLREAQGGKVYEAQLGDNEKSRLVKRRIRDAAKLLGRMVVFRPTKLRDRVVFFLFDE